MNKKIYLKFFIFLFLFFGCIDIYANIYSSIRTEKKKLGGASPENFYVYSNPDEGGGLTANNDSGMTGPMQRIRVDVVANDVLTCNDYSLRIITDLDPDAQGTATIDGDYIIFVPGIDSRGTTVAIEYGLTCNNVEVTGTLSVEVTMYNTPINVVPENAECIEDMASSITFGIRQKFATTTTTSGYIVDALSSPLVGDLNGDGKPEIIAMGVNHAYGYATARNNFRYISIFNGQDGSVMYSYDLGQNYIQGTHSTDAGPGYHRPPVALALADLDNDGIGEIILTTPAGDLKALKPVFNVTTIIGMNVMWTASVNFKAPLTSINVFRTPHPYVVDINGDGKPEVVVYNKIYNGQTGALLMAWQSDASSPTASNSSSTSGLSNINASAVTATTTSANATSIKNVAMTGRRPTLYTYTDRYTAVPAVWDIDGDGVQEIITGNRIHKFNIANNATSQSGNTYTTIEGPVSVSLMETTSGTGTRTTHYLSDGFTRVADIDGDGYLDIIVATLVQGALDVKILVYVWDPRYPSEVKAALTYYSDGIHGNFGIPFVGDINGKSDGWNGTNYELKLPEICIIAGGTYINRSTGNNGRSGIKFHPVSDESLRRGTSGTTGTTAGWDNNQTTNTNRRFNRAATDAANVYSGHIIGLTYDAAAADIEDRLKLGWAMEHNDRSDNTGITLFDFDNDGAKDLCYRDETTLRVISPARANNGQGSDYVPISETASTAGASVMFTTTCYSGTGFEYPTIADVNLDGSANIVVIGGPSLSVGMSGGNVRVYEYQGEKWAPAPPVWNQSLYNPLHVNEDLTIPARPQSMLTEYSNGTEIIRPFNGAWIQQPIVKEGQNYIPVVRQPDANITDMKVSVVNNTTATVTLSIRNNGTASINSNTPIAFYRNNNGITFQEATFIKQEAVGIDVFPNEKITLSYTLTSTGGFNEVLVWARIMDNGTSFPPTGYDDCDMTNNLMSGIDCPYLEYTVTTVPEGSTTICGQYGVVVLKAIPTNEVRETPTYQWYKDETIIPGATSQTYLAKEAGSYKCFVTEGICRGFSVNTLNVTKSYEEYGDEPNLLTIPENAKICGIKGSVYMYIDNYTGSSYLYYLYKDGELFSGPDTSPELFITEPGVYTAVVSSLYGGCNFISNNVTVEKDEINNINSPVIESTLGENMCDNIGKALLKISSPSDVTDMEFQWFKNGSPITNATLSWYIADSEGNYSLLIIEANGCSSYSNSLRINIEEGDIAIPELEKIPNKNEICVGGSLLLEVSNSSEYADPTYAWYKDGEKVKETKEKSYIVEDKGYYFVVVTDLTCFSISEEIYIDISTVVAEEPFIQSMDDLYELCGSESNITLTLTDEYIVSGQTYLWFRNEVPLYNETNYRILIESAGTYKVMVTNEDCSVFSNEREIFGGSITDFKAPIVNLDPVNGKLCGPGTSVFLYIINADGYQNPVYKWYNASGTLLQSGSGSTFIATEEGVYSVRVIDGVCTAISGVVNVTNSGSGNLTPPEVISVSGKNTICGSNGEVILQLKDYGSYPAGTLYSWYRDDILINDGSEADNFIYRATVPGEYKVRVINGECSAISAGFDVDYESNSLADPEFKRAPENGFICSDGGSIYLYIENAGSYESPNFIWFHEDEVLTSSTLASSYNATLPGNYYVMIVSGDCSVVTNTINILSSTTEINEPVISPTIGDNTICNSPGVVVLTLGNPNDFPGITGYQWYKNGLPISNATSRIYIAKETGNYRLQIMEANCSSMSSIYQVVSGTGSETVNEPQLAFDPESPICNNGITQISVSNSDLFAGATYIWFKDNVEVSRVTSPVYYATQSGTYFVQVYYNGCSSVSEETTLNLSPSSIINPIITVEPSSADICGEEGAVVISLTNYTSFYAPASFKWYKNDVELSGKIDPVLVVDRVLGEGDYRLRIQNGHGCVAYTSNIEVNYIENNAIIKPILEPSQATLYPETPGLEKVVLTVANVDPAASQYIWYDNDELLRRDQNSGTISYETGVAGNYFVQAVYSNSCAAVSNISEVIISGDYAVQPILNVIPESRKICLDGGIAIIEVTNKHLYTNPTYSWKQVSTPSDIEVSTEERFVTNTAGSYYVVVYDNTDPQNPTPSAPSAVVDLIDGDASIEVPVIVSTGDKICGSNGKVILYVENYATLYSSTAQYKWLRNGVEVQLGSSPAYVASVDGTYTLQVFDGDCLSESLPKSLSSESGNYPVPTISALEGNSLYVCGDDGTVILRLDSPELFAGATFQWFRNEIPLIGETDYFLRVDLSNSGVTTDDYYRLQASFGECSTLSERKLITSYNHISVEKPVLDIIPENGQICGNDGSVLLYVVNTGDFTGATYYWIKDNNQVVQQGNSSFYEATEEGDYTVYITGTTCSAESLPKTIESLTGNDVTKPTITNAGGNLCTGNSELLLIMTTLQSSYANPVYQWYIGSTALPGATLPRLTVTQSGNYRLHVIDGTCSSFSNVIDVRAGSGSYVFKPTITAIPDDKPICKTGGRILIRVNNTTNFAGATYVWYNGNTEIQRGTNPYYYAEEAGDYFVHVLTSNGCSAVSAEINIAPSLNEIEWPLLRTIPEDPILCGTNGRVVIGLTNTQDFIGFDYQWFKDNEPFSGQSGTIRDIPELFLTVFEKGEYRIQLVSGDCVTFSDPITVGYQEDGGVSVTPYIEVTPTNGLICGPNGSVMLRSRYASTYPAGTLYYWYQDDFLVKNSTDPYYEATGSAGEGTYYLQVVLPNGCSSSTYPGTKVNYSGDSSLESPQITSLPSENEICGEFGVVLLSLNNPEIYPNATYRWYKDNTSISQATSLNYKAKEAGSYRIQVTTTDGCAFMSSIIDIEEITSDMKQPLVALDPSNQLCGPNSSVIMTVSNVSNFSSGSTYIWFNGHNIVAQGVDMTIYEAKSAGTYSVQVIDGTCATLSPDYTIVSSSYVINNIPEIESIPSNAQICGTPDGVVVLTFTNQNLFPGYNIQWYKNNSPIAGATQSVYYAVEAGSYRVKVSIADCSAFSTPIDVELDSNGNSITKPTLVTYPENGYICEDSGSVILTVSNYDIYADGTTYMWYLGATVVYSGNEHFYETGVAGNYHVVVVEGDCASVSLTERINSSTNQIKEPQIESASGGNVICDGDGSVILRLKNVNDYSNTVTYQWFDENYEPIQDANELIYIATQAGKYKLQVIDGICSALSEEIDLSLPSVGNITKPVLSKTPDTDKICLNGSVRLNVTNTSIYTSPVFYWYNGADVVETGTLPYYDVTSAGTYFVQVAEGNDCSAVSDERMTFEMSNTLIGPANISTYPESNNICDIYGVVVINLENASSYTEATYRWYKNDELIVGANQKLYSATDEGYYRLEILTSDGCRLITDPIRITKDNSYIAEVNLDVFPVDARIVENNPVEMTVLNGADYTGSTYYWYKGTDIVASGVDLTRYDAIQAGVYRVLVVSGTDCATWSEEVNVTSSDPCGIANPVVNIIPGINLGNYELCLPEGSVLFQLLNLADYETPAIQWYKDNSPITGATAATLEVTNTVEYGAGAYRVSVSDQGCAIHSANHNVIAVPNSLEVKPEISAVPSSNNICTNGTVILRFTNSEEFFGVSYQWYKDNFAIPNATDLIYEASVSGKYRIVVLDGTCATLSSEIDLSLPASGTITKPVMEKVPDSNEICTNGSIKLYVSNTSVYTSPRYYWYMGTEVVQQGALSYYYAQDAGTYFVQVIDGNDCSAVPNEKITLEMSQTTIDPIAITSYPTNNVICGDNGVVVLRLTTSYSAGTTYQWYRNNNAIDGATDITYSATEAGEYYLEVLNAECSAISRLIPVSKVNGNSIEFPQVSKYPEEILGDNSVVLTFTNPSLYTSPEYYWFKDGKVTLLGSNTLTYETFLTGVFNLLVVDNGCARWSNDVDVDRAICTIDQPVLTVIPYPEKQICGANGSVLFQLTNASSYLNPVYEWYKGAELLAGNKPTLEVTEAGLYRLKVIEEDGCYNYSDQENIIYVESNMSKPLVEKIPDSEELCGNNASIVLRFTNLDAFISPSYQWYKDNYAIDGATGLIYEVTEPGSYRIIVRENGCLAMSVEHDITRIAGTINNVRISKSPNSDEICINGNVRLTVENISDYATGSEFIWYKGDQIVQRGTLTTYVCTSAGTYFAQVIEPGNCSATSEKIVLNQSTTSMITTPVIVSYPSDPATGNKIICGDDGVVLLRLSTSYAAGTTYQWYRNGIALPAATGIIYEATEPGSYYIEVKNSECAAISESVNVIKSSSSIFAKPDVSLDPVDGRIVEGLKATMNLENISDYTSPYYYWFRGEYNRFESTASVVEEGTDKSTYITDVVGDYKLLVVEGTCASISIIRSVTSEECPIADPQVDIVHNITGVCGDEGSVLLQIGNVDEYSTPAYQWYKDNSPITGQTRSTLEIIAGQDGLYQVAVIDGCRKVSVPAITITTSQTATIKPVVERIPENGEICGTNGSVILRFTNVSNFSGATYQWYKNNYAITNATESIFEVKEAGKYRVVVKDGNCLAMSLEEDIIFQSTGLIARPTISKTPNKDEICVNGNILLSIGNTTDYGTVTFIWYKDNEEVGRGTSYIAEEGGSYFVQVIDGTCSSTSRREILGMSGSTIASPIVLTYPESINSTVCGNEGVVVFRLTNPNQFAGAVYQWFRNNEPLVNETNTVYSATEAGIYYLQIILGDCSVISTPVTVIKNVGGTSLTEPIVSMFPDDGEIPSGGSVTLSFDNSGVYSNNVKYYWFKGKNELISENTLTYNASQSGRYYLLVVDGDCARWSQALDVTTGCEATKPILSRVPNNANIVCTPNGSILLQVVNTSDYLDPVYQWFNGTNVITGATASALEVTAEGDYRVRVSESGCKNYSDVASISTNNVPGLNKPLVTRIPDLGDLCGDDGGIILRFNNSGDFPEATYQWYKDKYAITNATNLIYEVTEPGKYSVVVIDGSCMAMSVEEDIKLINTSEIDKPELEKLPNSTQICINGSIRLYVNNTDGYDDATYIWYKGSEEIQNGSLSSYAATEPGTYFVQVIDGTTCSSISGKVTLTMGTTSITAPDVEVYPESKDVCANNGVVVLRVINANSYVGATYQWYKNGSALDGETYTILSTKDAGAYYVEVRTNDCYAVSTPVDVNVNSSCTIDPPVIAANPSDAKIVGGIPVILALQNVSSYSSSAKYYWYRDIETLVLEDDQISLSTDVVGVYKLLVVDGTKAAWSNEIRVEESFCTTTDPQLSVLPQSLDICGQNGSVYMSVTNMNAYTSLATFQWYKNNIAVFGATNPYYKATEIGTYELRVIDNVSGEYCIGISDSYTLTKSENSQIEKLEIRMTPSSGNLCIDGSVILYVYNRGAYENATYQWYRNGLLINGATGNTFEVKYEDQAENQATYTAQVIVSGCAAMAEENLVINKSANYAIDPEISASGSKVCGEHGSVLLMLTNEADFGNGTKYYQWFYNNELIAGATNSTYEADLGGNYRLQVVSGLCGAFSGEIVLEGSADNIPKPLVETAPQNGVICGEYGSVLLYVTNVSSYTNPVYQWYKNNMPIQGATESVYEATERAYYRVQISEGECSALSVQKLLISNDTEIERPNVETIPSLATEICGDNGVIVLRLSNVSDYVSPTYQWYNNNIAISGETSLMYVAKDAGNYRLQVVEGQCSSISGPLELSKNNTHIELPQLAKTPDSGYICEDNGSVLLTVSNNSEYNNATYVWYNGTTIVQNDGNFTYMATTEGDYYVQVVEGSCSSYTGPAEVRNSSDPIEEPVIISTSGGYNVCGTNGVVVLQLTNVTDFTNATYQWYMNNVAIPGATDIICHATEAGEYMINVIEDDCSVFSSSKTITKDNSVIVKPVLSKSFDSSHICGKAGSILLTVSNAGSYTNANYIWFKGNEIVQNGSTPSYYAEDSGSYYVQVIEGSCSSVSSVTVFDPVVTEIEEPVIISTSGEYNICGTNGAVVLQLTNASDYTGATYQWYVNNVAIPGATDIICHATEAGEYRINVIEDDCSAFSSAKTITKDNSTIAIPVLSKSFDSNHICGKAGSILLTVSNAGSYTNANYIWFKGDEIVQNGSTPSYYAEDSGSYYVQVVEGSCSSVSAVTVFDPVLTEIEEPVIVSTSGGYNVCGTNGVVVLQLTNAADYTGATYQWYLNDITITGATDVIYHAKEAGEYRINVIEGDCSAFSPARTITKDNSVIAEPKLTMSPANGMISDGSNVVITVNNNTNYTNATYIWFRGTEIVQNSGSFTYEATVEGTYYVQVIEGTCSSISESVEVERSGLPLPQVNSVPSSNNICGANGVVVMSLINADDYNNPIYQWHKNDIAIPGATNITYQATEAGYYTIYVNTQSDGIFSEVITLTKDNSYIAKPVLETEPDDYRLCGDGGNVVISVLNTSEYTNVTYIWYSGDEIVQTGTNPVYITNTIGNYYVQVVDGGCSTVSEVLNVRNSNNEIERALIAAIPDSYTICGNNGVVILRLTNYDVYSDASYQWYKDGIAIPGAVSIVYHATSAGNYYIKVAEGDCISFSESITLIKNNGSIAKPTLTLSPASGIISDGGSVLITVNNYSSYTGATYVWYKDDKIISTGTAFTLEATQAGTYYVQVVEGDCSSVSNPEQLYLSGVNVPTPIITSLPNSNVICGDNGVVILRLTNSNDYIDPVFQWYRDNMIIPGANSILYQATEAGSYKLQVSVTGGAAYSRVVPITKEDVYIAVPELSKVPVGGYLCGEYSSVLLSVTNTLEFYNASYVWYKDNRIVQNGPRSSYEATEEGKYFVQVIEGNCSSVSEIENVRNSATYLNEPNVIAVPTSNNVCGENGVVILRLTNAADYPNATYQWYRFNEPISGATSTIYTTTIAGEYRIHIMQDHCAAFSSAIEVTKDDSFIAKPVLKKTPTTGYICGENGTVLMYVDNVPAYNNATYIWYKGAEVLQNSNIPNYEVTLAGDDYYVQVVEGGCSAVSDKEEATLSSAYIEEPIISSTPGNSICGENGAVTLRLANPEDYNANAVYQWFKNDVAIPNTNSVLYHVTEAGEYRILVDDIACAAFSTVITITKNNGFIEKPLLAKSPTSGHICEDAGSVILAVTNSSVYDTPLFVWYNGNEVVQQSVLHTYEATEEGEYYVQVIEGSCSSLSKSEMVYESSSSINAATITSIPSSNNVCGDNGVVVLRLTNASSYDNPTYQWYRNNVAIPGATSSVYHATASGDYKIQVVEDNCGTTSPVIKVTRDESFITKPILVSDPESKLICNGGYVILSVSNSSSYTNATYVWYYGTEIVQNSTSPVYEATAEGIYYVQVVEGGCSSVSTTVELMTNPNPLPTATISGDAIIVRGSETDITIDLTGTAPWIVEYNDTETFVINSTPYVFTVSPTETVTYKLNNVTDANGCTNSASGSVTITVYDLPTVVVIDYLTEICKGATVNMILSFTGKAPWEIAYNDGTGIKVVSNIMDSEYTLKVQPVETTTISLISVKDANTINENLNEDIIITVLPDVVISKHPQSPGVMCEGNEMELSVEATGSGLNYQWFFNNSPISGATASTYKDYFTPDMIGTYHVVVSGDCGTVSSESVQIEEGTVKIEFKWDNVMFISNPNDQYVRYQWYLDGKEILQDGNSQYYYNDKGVTGTYTVRAYYADGTYDETCSAEVMSVKSMEISVFPNPISREDQLSILIENYIGEYINAKVEIYDALGKMLYDGTITESLTKVPVKMSPGTCMVRVITENGQLYIYKVIVE